MRIFIVSRYGSSKDLALKLLSEGHDVTMYITNTVARSLQDYPFIVAVPSPDMLNVELFCIEDGTAGAFADKARDLGRPTLGGGSFNDRLIRNPVFLEKTGIGCGFRMATEDTKGIPIRLGGWFCGEEFIRPYFLGIHYARVGAGDVGKKTKGMGIAGQYRLKGKVFNLLRQMETALKTANYQGFVDLSAYINNESARIESITLGLEFPVLALITAIHNTMGGFLFKAATGLAKQVAVQPDKAGVGVVWLPNLEKAPICPTMLCGTGENIKEATNSAYKAINKLSDSNAYYRVDIGLNYDTHMTQLRKWEWI